MYVRTYANNCVYVNTLLIWNCANFVMLRIGMYYSAQLDAVWTNDSRSNQRLRVHSLMKYVFRKQTSLMCVCVCVCVFTTLHDMI